MNFPTALLASRFILCFYCGGATRHRVVISSTVSRLAFICQECGMPVLDNDATARMPPDDYHRIVWFDLQKGTH